MESIKSPSPEKGGGPKTIARKLWHGIKTLFAGIVLTLFAIIVIVQVVSHFTAPKSTPTPPVEQAQTYSDTEVYVDAKAIIEKALKAPSTAKYPSSSDAKIERSENNRFKVTSYVDSQNSFGAMIRSDWSVTFQYVGDQVKTYQVILGDQEIYRSPDMK